MQLTLYNAVIVAIVLISLYFRYRRHIKKPKKLESDDWQEVNALATELGLTFSEHSNEHYNGGWIHGTYQDVAINIQDESTYHNRGKYSYVTVATLYEAFLGDKYNIEGLEVSREELLTKVSKAFGTEDIQVGHEEIDKAFIIRANSELDAQRLFASPEVRSSFLNLQTICSKFHLKDGILTLEFQEGIFQKHNRLHNRIKALVLCAQAIMNHKDHTPTTLPQPAELYTEPDQEEFENTTISW